MNFDFRSIMGCLFVLFNPMQQKLKWRKRLCTTKLIIFTIPGPGIIWHALETFFGKKVYQIKRVMVHCPSFEIGFLVTTVFQSSILKYNAFWYLSHFACCFLLGKLCRTKLSLIMKIFPVFGIDEELFTKWSSSQAFDC